LQANPLNYQPHKFYQRAIALISKEQTMSRLFQRTSRAITAALALLLVGGAVAFAQHNNAALTRIFASSARAVATAVASPAAQQVASNKPVVKIFLAGFVERNSKQISIANAGAVKPGEVVKFTLNSTNEGTSAAREYRAVGQVPQGTSFVAGSASGDRLTSVSYSIDGGQRFSSRPMIEEKQADGTVKQVAAPASMYTQVRFEWADPLAAGNKLNAAYQVRVK